MPREFRDVMVGAGGRIVRPQSEGAALTAAIQHIVHGDYREALDVLKRLREQVQAGYHRNPSTSRLYQPFRIVGPIAEDVYDIRYRHHKNGKDYEHEFNGSASILAVMRHGKKEMLITSDEGLPLWDEFPDDK